ncbi:LuxR family transcriptional regulator [Paractinoplanes deccanensis]|uniref:LuxR family transcriptional regulator n=1 Tax=Paractinoplanes deccanensis TaxID=113561 RepID=A0ABQ3Y2Z3_9ACTN|nr:LuxR family transcriptional regulator [Actinoplanes deccanensis]GID74364.1 LuxR family transcriptional regulator [Actinoplanes deccanensis]
MAEEMLRGRRREREELDRLLRDVRSGRSRALVLRGEAGVGKSALLDHLAGQAEGVRVERAAGVELESEITYSALQQLCAPLLASVDRLPAPQRAALMTAVGLAAGKPPEPLLVGLAVLGLFSEAASQRPLLCIVDDVQWLDRMSELILTFVARRLDAESVALVFAVRAPATSPAGLPEMTVEGLADADARVLLDSALPGPVDSRVRDRIVAETRGNPLALLELPRGLSAAELAFGFGGLSAAPLAGRLEHSFQRRIAALPADTRKVLLAAAVEPVGDVHLLWRALDLLGIGPEAAVPAETAQLIDLSRRARFPHPLVRSAAWRSGSAADLREVHRVLAEVTDPQTDPDRRAWHRAHAVAGPDEEVADELERSADRARARGGWSAAAAFLERAAQLTLDPDRRVSLLLAAARAHSDAGSFAQVPELLGAAEMGPLQPLQRARVEQVRAHVAFVLNPGRESGPPLLEAAHQLRDLDPAAARETYLTAIGAAVHTGRADPELLPSVARAAAQAPPGDDLAGLMLTGLTAWVLDGYEAAAPAMNRAVEAMTAMPDEDLRLIWLAAPMAYEMFRFDVLDQITSRAVRVARDTGALSLLPNALALRAGVMHYLGRLDDSSSLVDEAEGLMRATGSALQLSGAVPLAAYRGREPYASQLVNAMFREASSRGEGWSLGIAGYFKAALHNGLGDYPEAFEAAREAASYPDLAIYHWNLGELVEAATRTGASTVAADARERLSLRTSVTGTDWARGVQALADALVLADEGRFRDSIAYFSSAGMGMQMARAHLLFGEWLRREARRSEARAQLRTAHDAFTRIGAEAFAGRAARELAATGETVRAKAPGTAEQLTSQETQIARLAVTGRTNPEIGASLFLSPRTVEWHLRKIFTKLGITSRRELAAVLHF